MKASYRTKFELHNKKKLPIMVFTKEANLFKTIELLVEAIRMKAENITVYQSIGDGLEVDVTEHFEVILK